MNRRQALKTLTALPAAMMVSSVTADNPVAYEGIEGQVSVLFKNKNNNKAPFFHLDKFTTKQQCINDFARYTIQNYPTAFVIKLTIGDISIDWYRDILVKYGWQYSQFNMNADDVWICTTSGKKLSMS